MTDDHQFCTFVVGGLYFGIEVLQVQEVIRYQEMTRVPLSSPVIQGLINLRGQIVTAIDLRRRLDLPERPADRRPMNVVVRTEDGAVSLLVDEIGDVLQADQGSFEPVPDTIVGAAREMVEGVYKLKDRLLLVLKTRKAIDVC